MEAAAYFDIANILMVIYANTPEPPFEPIQKKFDHFDRVIWSIIGDSASHLNIKKRYQRNRVFA